MKQSVIILFTLQILYLSCTNDNSSDNSHSRSLGWGLDIANKIRDKELPNGYLVEIQSGNIDSKGNLMPSEQWDFWYVDTSAQNINYLHVTVNYSGSADFSDPQSVINYNKIPEYTTGAEWIDAADQVMERNHYKFVSRYIQVFAPDNLPPVVGVYYDYPQDGSPYVCVWLNADTNEFIEFEYF